MRAATVRARVNAIHTGGSREETKLIDGPISFPPVNLNRVIVPYYVALVLTLCISDFNVHRVLVDPSSATDLLELPALNKMKLSLEMLNLVARILSGFIGATTTRSLYKKDQLPNSFFFSVVEDLGRYNDIVDQIRLNSMKVVPSTYH